jgi:hypothetical protein
VKYLGRALCWNVDHNHRGTQWEPHGPGTGPDPIMATSLETRYVAEIERRAYLDTYAESLDLWQQGDHTVIFPFGTWNVVRHHAAVVAVPPPTSGGSAFVSAEIGGRRGPAGGVCAPS